MNKLTFGDIKKLEYNDNMPFEYVLVDLLYEKEIDVNFVLSCYTNALDRERHLNAMRFNEACTNLTQILGGNFKGKEKLVQTLHRYLAAISRARKNKRQSSVPSIHSTSIQRLYRTYTIKSMGTLVRMKKNGMSFVK